MREIRQAYDAIAEVYDSEVLNRPFYQNWDKKIRDLLEKYVPSVETSSGVKAIDLGCGTGQYTALLLDKGYHVVAVDCSSKMVQATVEKLSCHNGRLKTVESDILDLEISEGNFTVVTSFSSVVNHISDWESFFDKISGLLAPGNLLIFDFENVFGIDYPFHIIYSYVFNKPQKTTWRELVGSARGRFGSKPYSTTYLWEFNSKNLYVNLTYYSLKSIKAMLKANGFEILELDGVNIFSSALPQVALTATYPPDNLKGTQSALLRRLNKLDTKLGRFLHPIAGIQFVVARKV